MCRQSRFTVPVLLLLLVALAIGCRSDEAQFEPDAAFTPYISAFTAGHVPARAPILIRIADDQRWRDSSMASIQRLFTLSPKVEGSVSWQDDRTLAFRPSTALEQERTYTVSFQLGQLIEVPKGLEVFRFQVTAFRQGLNVKVSEMQSLSTTDLKWQRLILSVHTSDEAEPEALGRCLTAVQDGRALNLVWEHDANGRNHRVVADSVRRGDGPSAIELAWNGKAIGSSDAGELRFDVPSIGDLALISWSTFSDGEQTATLIFSDPLDAGQELTGLVGISGAADVRVDVDGNRLILYPKERLSGEQQGFIPASLRNINGRQLNKELTVDLTFEELKPAVRMVGKGVILPSTEGLVMPFEAVNLSAVEVRVIRIHESNIGQFLQVNDLGGTRELARVGRLITRKVVALSTPDNPDLGRWNRYYLDLEKHIKAEPGAIYRVELSFDQQHSVYPCGTAMESPDGVDRTWDEEQADFDRVQDYWYYDDDEYGWYDDDERSSAADPCSADYFARQRRVSRNLLASDLGLIAKRGNDGSLFVAVSDLRSAKPMSSVKLEVLDLQRKSMGSVVTDREGLATLPPTRNKPFLLVASHGAQRGYLKLDDGSSLSVSEFDVVGEAIDRGLKGYLYGERGVWRPGDSLFLNFILQDLQHKLPKDHPVVLQFFDPRGRLDQKHVRTTSVDRVYSFRIATSHDAPTGVWSAKVLVGGTTFQRSIRIETVKPNRLKVLIDLEGERLTSDVDRQVKLRSHWLHGAPAKELLTRVTVTLGRSKPDFKGYERFQFDDLSTRVPDEEQVVFDGRLNSAGEASFPLHIDAGRNAPAAMNANIVTRVFEQGGDASMDRVTVPFLPYASYAAIKAPETRSSWGNLVTDTTYRFEVAALSAQGKPLAGKALKAQVYRMNWNWWWDGEMSGAANYIISPSVELRQEMDLITDTKGRAHVDFRIDRPEWGRFAVRITDPSSGHSSAAQVHVDWPGWEGRSQRQNASQATMLRFNSDKERYVVGEQATLTIPSGANGRALVSLETGSKVLDAVWVDLKDKETQHTFTVTADMVPNVYAHVTVVQAHAQTRNDLPIRLYGVIPLLVEDPSTRCTPVIAMSKEVRTDVPFAVDVSEKNGERMTYTLAIVDEGLLDLTRFRTPDPWKHFHAREALGVRTWDVYDQVIGAFGQQLQRLLALGGSDELGKGDAARANRFKPVVRHVGPFTLEPGKKAKHSFTISDYVGSVRVMVVATDGDRAYGNAEKTVAVRKPLMLLATMPRMLSPGEVVDLPITVFAMDAKVKEVIVKLDPNALLIPEGPSTKSIRFSATGEQVVTFKVRVKEAVGVAKMKITAEGAGELATERIELQVRQPNLPRTDVTEAMLEPGKSWQQAPVALGVAGTNSAYLELSSIPPVDLGRRLQFLIAYPHGCLEQTTSRAFPQLYLASVMELPERSVKQMRSNVETAIRQMIQFQRSDGGFNYWSGGDHYDAWTSIYAGHFLVEAERQGFAVPSGMRSNWLSNQRRSAREWSGMVAQGWTTGATELTQAYRLYVLALARSEEVGAMNRLRERTGLSKQAKWMLAAAYAHIGRKDAATDLVKALDTTVPAYTEQAFTFGSDLRDQALIAEALLAMGDFPRAGTVVKRIAELLSSGEWYSTQSTAFGLMAVARLAERNPLGQGMSYTLKQAGASTEHNSKKSIAKIELATPDGKTSIAVTNTGKGPMYLRLVRTGTPMAGQETASANGLVMSVRYELMDGSALDPARIEQGTDFRAVVKVGRSGATGPIRHLALTQVFPSGWEIRNARMEGSEEAARGSAYTYRDQRDDRVMTYFDLRRDVAETYTVSLNAAYTGRYYMPGAQVEAMYDHTLNARSTGGWVEVLPAGGERSAAK